MFRRTNNFHNFVKMALTKNPKKRPPADKLLQVGGTFLYLVNLSCYVIFLVLILKYIF